MECDIISSVKFKKEVQMSIHKKLLEVQKSMPRIDKDSTNPHFKNKYASLANCLSVINPALNALGLYHRAEQAKVGEEERISVIITDVESGESIATSLPLLNKTDMQKMGGCITYTQRYGLLPLLGIAAEMDDDGNKACEVEKPKKVKEKDEEVERMKLCMQLDKAIDECTKNVWGEEDKKIWDGINRAAEKKYENATIAQLESSILWIKENGN